MKKLIAFAGFAAISAVALLWQPATWQSDAALLKPERLSLQGASLPLPEFGEYQDVKEKKQAFFAYFSPLIEAKNSRILALREQVKVLANQKELSEQALERLNALSMHYGMEARDQFDADDFDKLLARMDQLPASLVLAQAAIESAWGTSRFAREGANYFGQWCYSKGCGLVPAARSAEARHEVRVFDSPAASVDAYFKNINSHRAYRNLRGLRQQARQEGVALSGCRLAEGLKAYSELGETYVREVKSLIRVNKLEPRGAGTC